MKLKPVKEVKDKTPGKVKGKGATVKLTRPKTPLDLVKETRNTAIADMTEEEKNVLLEQLRSIILDKN